MAQWFRIQWSLGYEKVDPKYNRVINSQDPLTFVVRNPARAFASLDNYGRNWWRNTTNQAAVEAVKAEVRLSASRSIKCEYFDKLMNRFDRTLNEKLRRLEKKVLSHQDNAIGLRLAHSSRHILQIMVPVTHVYKTQMIGMFQINWLWNQKQYPINFL